MLHKKCISKMIHLKVGEHEMKTTEEVNNVRSGQRHVAANKGGQ